MPVIQRSPEIVHGLLDVGSSGVLIFHHHLPVRLSRRGQTSIHDSLRSADAVLEASTALLVISFSSLLLLSSLAVNVQVV